LLADCTASGYTSGFHFNSSGEQLWAGTNTVYPFNNSGVFNASEVAYPGGAVIRATPKKGLSIPTDASVNPPLILQ
jgi:hypothetical protein